MISSLSLGAKSARQGVPAPRGVQPSEARAAAAGGIGPCVLPLDLVAPQSPTDRCGGQMCDTKAEIVG